MLKKPSVILLCSVFLSSCTSFYQLVNISPSSKLKEISYSNDAPNELYTFYYADTVNNAYLHELETNYNLKQLVNGEKDDVGKIKNILDWTSKQWEHNGINNPSKQDALTILKEAHEGKQFRCVEYGIVATAALNCIGMPARTLGLKTRDVEKVRRGAGHVVSEVYSGELDKWIFIDPQFNIMPTLNATPLNGVEFQKAIYNENVNLKLVNKQGELSREEAESYINWVAKYLFYFDVLFDQQTLNSDDFKTINGMTKLTLVPVGYKEPHIFQRHSKINYSYYTNSLNDFYRAPN
ncbi:transglutaminase-like domain-containing protein [Draconibacterium sediminis]|uniref:transglutaminase-like domain-containing protein n=1 Tax=Draconibacterium sediminis TaxID=1544798 RepID=UPI0009E5B38D|nr:transglutaminase-like domain-containing protein [Draconibacterium sediminis]